MVCPLHKGNRELSCRQILPEQYGLRNILAVLKPNFRQSQPLLSAVTSAAWEQWWDASKTQG